MSSTVAYDIVCGVWVMGQFCTATQPNLVEVEDPSHQLASMQHWTR